MGTTSIRFRSSLQSEFLREGARRCRLHAARPHHPREHRAYDLEKTLREIYAPFNRNHEKIIVMDARSAGAQRSTRRTPCSRLAHQLRERDGRHRRACGADIEWGGLFDRVRPGIGYSFIYSGIGYGGLRSSAQTCKR